MSNDLALRAAASMVRLCDDCCPACRAAAAAALGEKVDRCFVCGNPVLRELGPCPCVEQALAGDRIKIEQRARYENRPVEEIEAEFRALYASRSIAA